MASLGRLVDLLPRIEDGENVIRLRLRIPACWTYGWKLRLDGDVVAEDSWPKGTTTMITSGV